MADFTPKGKNAPTVDMTPMVDLGFLLITFFMLASSFMSPKIIKMLSPADGDTTTAPPLKCSKSLTLIVHASNKVKYYTCPESSQPDSIDFSAKGLRKLVLDRQQEVQAQWGDKKELIVLLKLTPDAQYKRLVDAIDEMNLTQSTFIMAHLDKQDSTVMKW